MRAAVAGFLLSCKMPTFESQLRQAIKRDHGLKTKREPLLGPKGGGDPIEEKTLLVTPPLF